MADNLKNELLELGKEHEWDVINDEVILPTVNASHAELDSVNANDTDHKRYINDVDSKELKRKETA